MAKKAVAEKKDMVDYRGIGRRKEAIAKVRLVPGKGNFMVNDKALEEYFGLEVMTNRIKKPLEITETLGKFDVIVKAEGGGIAGQAGAIVLGIARALLEVDETFRADLKKAGFLTRDPREKERRKYGLKKARKAPQFSKR